MSRRILLLCTDLEIGGTPTVVRELALRLNGGAGAAVRVACLSGRGPVAEMIEAGGVQVTAFGARGTLELPRAVARLCRLVREQRIDTVMSFLVHANATAALAAALLREVRFIQSIQTTQARPAWHWKVQGLAQLAAEAVVVPSTSVAAWAHRTSGVPAEKFVVIPNAVDLAAWRDVPMAGEAVKSVGFIGRLDPVKRIGDLVEASGQLPAEMRVHIFGEGRERSALEAQIAQLGAAGRVVMHGAVERPQWAMAEIDVLVLPSEAEGFGLVLIEAMAAGRAVVATRAPGIVDVVRDRETGLLVDIGAPEQIAAAVMRIAQDGPLRSRLVENGRAEVAANYGWDAVLPKYRALLGIG